MHVKYPVYINFLGLITLTLFGQENTIIKLSLMYEARGSVVG
jgi:hypothetical protein